jgi:hypothetical protein
VDAIVARVRRQLASRRPAGDAFRKELCDIESGAGERQQFAANQWSSM